MDIWSAIKNRRSIRKYKREDVPYEVIFKILDYARWAPSSGNLQNWKFIIVKDYRKRLKIAEACYNQWFISQAPVVIVVCSETNKVVYEYGKRGWFFAIQNVAALIQNILLCAYAEGLGSCWVGAFEEDKIKEILNIPKDIEVHAVIPIGYPDENPTSERIDLDKLVYFEVWGNSVYTPKFYPLIEKLEDLKNMLLELKEKIKKV